MTSHRKSTRSPSLTYFAILLLLVTAFLFVIFFRQGPGPAPVSGPNVDQATIERLSGLHGRFDPKYSVFSVSLIRPGLHVKIEGTQVAPAFGLSGWATLSGTEENAVLVGDIPLLEEEVNGALLEAVKLGLEVTALHNRFLMDSPRIMSLHFSFLGKADVASKALGQLFKDVASGSLPKMMPFSRPATVTRTPLTEDRMNQLLWKGRMEDGVYRITFGLGTSLGDQPLGGAMGVKSWAAFTGSLEGAVVNGEIAVIEPELQEVLQILLKSGLRIVSIHEHFIQEVPKLVFVHFMGAGTAKDLAAGVRTAVEAHDFHTSR